MLHRFIDILILFMLGKFCQRGSNSATLTIFFRGERIQIPLKAGQHRPASETPFNSLIALRISGVPGPLSPSGSAHAFEHPTYIRGIVGGWGGGGLGNSENLESLTKSIG